MSRRNKNMLFSFNGNFQSEENFHLLTLLFESYQNECAQSKVSEIININNHSIKRNELKIKMILNQTRPKSFVFINCLN
jgi:hypothetical protein